MRTFHTGGVAGGGDITTGLPRVEEIFEVRPPKGKAILSDVSGEVLEIAVAGRERIIRVQIEPETGSKLKKKFLTKLGVAQGDIKEFIIPPATGILVEKGTKIKKGDLLSEGRGFA
jgi:DNA-directed RNA polymerase subunit beta'